MRINEDVNDWIDQAEKLIGLQLMDSVNDIGRYIKNISTLICPVLNVAYEMQFDYGDVNLKKVITKDSGLWMSSVCVNAKTCQYHSEDDCTYTVVKVPKQNKEMNGKYVSSRVFMLQINESTTFTLPLEQNLTFLYSGNFITHRQECDNKSYHDGSLFFNITSYGNKRIFSHLRKSFLRNIQ